MSNKFSYGDAHFFNRYLLPVPCGCLSNVCVYCTSNHESCLPLNTYQAAFTQELGRHVEINGLNAQIDFRKKLYFGELVSILAIGSTKLSILAFYWRTFGFSRIMRMLIRVTAGVVVCGTIGFVSFDPEGVVPHPWKPFCIEYCTTSLLVRKLTR